MHPASPHDTGPRLAGKHRSAGYVRVTSGGQRAHVIVEIHVKRLVRKLALCLLRPDAGVQWFNIRHIAP